MKDRFVVRATRASINSFPVDEMRIDHFMETQARLTNPYVGASSRYDLEPIVFNESREILPSRRVRLSVFIREERLYETMKYSPVGYGFEKQLFGTDIGETEVHAGDGVGIFYPTGHIVSDRDHKRLMLIYTMEGDLDWKWTPNFYYDNTTSSSSISHSTYAPSTSSYYEKMVVSGRRSGKKHASAKMRERATRLTDLEWLDQRIEEVVDHGKLN